MGVGKFSLQAVLGHSVGDLVREDHPYRRLLLLVPFDELCKPLESKYSRLGRRGYPVTAIFKALLLQFMEELSDRELERFLQENLAGKLFCGFELTDETPDFSTFSVMRDRIGAEGLAEIFRLVQGYLKDAGLVREVFTFVDATHLITKVNLWNERDKVIAAGERRLSNSNLPKVAVDKQARLGKKGGLKWFGYKFHVAVDMSQGFITKIAATPGNVEDEKGARHVLPGSGMVLADKAYCSGDAIFQMKKRGLHSGATLRKHMRGKNPEKDRWLGRIRLPFESTFSKFEKRARYRGCAKCQFQGFMQALSHNMKRLLVLDPPPLGTGPSCV